MEKSVIVKVKKTNCGVEFSNDRGAKWLFPHVPLPVAITAAVASTLNSYMTRKNNKLKELELKLTLVVNP